MHQVEKTITYVCTFQRTFEVQVHAPDVKLARVMADRVLAGFPKDTCKIISLIPLGQEELVVAESVSGKAVPIGEARTLARNAGLAAKVREQLTPKDKA